MDMGLEPGLGSKRWATMCAESEVPRNGLDEGDDKR